VPAAEFVTESETETLTFQKQAWQIPMGSNAVLVLVMSALALRVFETEQRPPAVVSVLLLLLLMLACRGLERLHLGFGT